MSTNDVPGHNPSNNDVLATGCWAEAEDGSLIFIAGVEGGRVIFNMFDVATTPITDYRSAMPEKEFKRIFSHDPIKFVTTDSKGRRVPMAKWSWHDKSLFPWDRVIQRGAQEGVQDASSFDTIEKATRVTESLARQVARALRATGQAVDDANLKHMLPSSETADGIIGKLHRAANAFFDELGR